MLLILEIIQINTASRSSSLSPTSAPLKWGWWADDLQVPLSSDSGTPVSVTFF